MTSPEEIEGREKDGKSGQSTGPIFEITTYVQGGRKVEKWAALNGGPPIFKCFVGIMIEGQGASMHLIDMPKEVINPREAFKRYGEVAEKFADEVNKKMSEKIVVAQSVPKIQSKR